MEAIAKARFQRISPRKARVVVNLIRGKNVAVAIDQLRFTQKGAAKIPRLQERLALYRRGQAYREGR